MIPALPTRRPWTAAERLLTAAVLACLLLTGAGLALLHREMTARRESVEERLRRDASATVVAVASDFHDALHLLRRAILRGAARAEAAPGRHTSHELIAGDGWALESAWHTGIVLGPMFRVRGDTVTTLSRGPAAGSGIRAALDRPGRRRFAINHDRILARAADTVLLVLDSLPDGSWRGAEVPLYTLREGLWRPRMRSLETGSRWADSSGSLFAPTDTLVSYAIHRGPGQVPLLVHGDTARTPWRRTLRLIDLDDVWLTVTSMPPLERLLIPGGLPPSPWPRLLVLGAAALVVIALSAWLAWRALALGRAREAFAASVTHELRTPLTGITLFAETLLLDRAGGPEARRRALQTIAGEAQRLAALVENVLTMARRGQAEERLQVRATSLGDLLRSVEDAFAPILTTTGVALRCAVSGPDLATIDPEAARRILVNLVENALRHAADATSITVDAIHDDRGVTIVVADDGIGVAPPDARRIWDAWEHGPGGGSGLGLAVVLRLARLHGGSARLAPSARGARFEVTLATGIAG